MEEYVKINKLFLVGNGLDLALGLKTGYNHFMFWLLKKHLLLSLENYGQQTAPEGYNTYNYVLKHYERDIVFAYSENELFDVIIKENYGNENLKETFSKFETLEDVLNFLNKPHLQISINPKNEHGLFNEIYKQINIGWVNIEENYFQGIKNLIKNENSWEIKEDIIKLNKELQSISDELKVYLLSIKTDVNLITARKYGDQFVEKIKPSDIISKKFKEQEFEVGDLYFLNFNYTNTLLNIKEQDNRIKGNSIINHIHGYAKGKESIIFGYGDEMDEYYKTIENLRDNEFFKHIKSFQYFKNKNYRDLLRFLNSNDFQVCIYGHSCDISDRVMLNEIFEHENCVSVKVYFYKDEDGNSDFTNKTMNISRHFNSNKLMREKIVEFNPENEIPQIK